VFSCPKCGHDKAWITGRYLYVCAACGKQTSLIAGTIFEGTRLPLLTWFRAAWMVASNKGGVSAKELQRELGDQLPGIVVAVAEAATRDEAAGPRP
jgi:hypothetical protein